MNTLGNILFYVMVTFGVAMLALFLTVVGIVVHDYAYGLM